MLRVLFAALTIGTVAAFGAHEEGPTEVESEVGRRGLFSAFFGLGQSDFTDWAGDGLKSMLVNAIDWYFGSVDHDVTIGTTTSTFTKDNYYTEMIDFLVASLEPDQGEAMEDWYLRYPGSPVDGGRVRQGPGPNTETRMGFKHVVDTLSSWGEKIAAGTLVRNNELGMQLQGPGGWPEYPEGERTIGLGQTNENHAFVRPFLGNLLDKARDEGRSCDGSSCWNEAWLKAEAGAFFRGRDSVSADDLKPFVTKVLHKIHLGMELNDAQAAEFSGFMGKLLTLGPLQQDLLESSLVERVLGASDTVQKKLDYFNDVYKPKVLELFGHLLPIGPDRESKLTLLTSNIMDSLIFAGGLSVATVISYVVAITHIGESRKHAVLRGEGLSKDNLDWIVWETIRKYAPVGAVPFWEVQADGSAKHVLPSVAQALMDPEEFEDPLTFKNRGNADFFQGVAWAAPARVNNDVSHPDSHDCPGRELSLAMTKTFLTALIEAGPFKAVAPEEMIVKVSTAGGWSLLKAGLTHTTECAYFPECKGGYTRQSENGCGWGRRRFTCVV